MTDDVISALVTAIARVERDTDPQAIREVVRGFKMSGPRLTRELAVIGSNPLLLRSTEPSSPFWERIAWALWEKGSTDVLRPACPHCGNVRRLHGYLEGQRVCRPCHAAQRRVVAKCEVCGTPSERQSTFLGRDVCRSCFRRDKPSARERLGQLSNERLTTLLGRQVRIEPGLASTMSESQAYRLFLELSWAPTDWFRQPEDGTLAFGRFYDSIAATGLPLPPRTCYECHRARPLTSVLNGKRVCQTCASRTRRRTCSGCGKEQAISRLLPDGSPLCNTCVNHLPENISVCSSCGAERRLWDGRCRPCIRQDYVDTCRTCNRTVPCRFPGTDQAICESCAVRPRACRTCGRIRAIHTRYADGSGDCARCAEPVLEECSDCHRVREVSARADGRPYCKTCGPKNPAFEDDCVRCGKRDHLSRIGLCKRCRADDLIDELMGERIATGDPLDALAQSLRSASPRLVFDLIKRKRSARIMEQVFQAGSAVTHEFLSTLGTPIETLPVRSLLVDSGVLQARDEHLARLEDWIKKKAEKIARPVERHAFTQFARWRHLRRLREQGSPVTYPQVGGPKTELTQIVNLLDWIPTELRDLDQRSLDRWIASGPGIRVRVKHFLRWTHSNHLISRRLVVGSAPHSDLIVVDDDHAEAQRALRRVLDPSESMSGPDRLAGALLVLFGALPHRIAQLKLTDLIETRSGYSVLLGEHPVELPTVLNEAVRETIASRSTRRLLGPVSDWEWLFPGPVAGQPLSAGGITDRLVKVSIPIRSSRRAALSALALQLPPAIIAQLTGVSVNTATAWAAAVSATAARYAPTRAPS